MGGEKQMSSSNWKVLLISINLTAKSINLKQSDSPPMSRDSEIRSRGALPKLPVWGRKLTNSLGFQFQGVCYRRWSSGYNMKWTLLQSLSINQDLTNIATS